MTDTNLRGLWANHSVFPEKKTSNVGGPWSRTEECAGGSGRRTSPPPLPSLLRSSGTCTIKYDSEAGFALFLQDARYPAHLIPLQFPVSASRVFDSSVGLYAGGRRTCGDGSHGRDPRQQR